MLKDTTKIFRLVNGKKEVIVHVNNTFYKLVPFKMMDGKEIDKDIDKLCDNYWIMHLKEVE